MTTIFNSLSPLQVIETIALGAIAIYHQVANYRDRHQSPPGEIVTLTTGKRHLQLRGTGEITIVVDASLGGVEGYLLIDELAKLSRVCIYDRAGYGWSQTVAAPRTSQQIVTELHELLTQARIQPPYLLVGDSFGSYNLRLYAHQYPDRVCGLVLTDGLHERSMLALPWSVGLLKAFFTFSFGFVTLCAAVGLMRLVGSLGGFELIKPELRQFPPLALGHVKRSFYSSHHWLTMAREMWSLDASGRQLLVVESLGDLPIVSIKAQTFLRPVLGISWLSLPAADRVRERIHRALAQLSTNYRQVAADRSSHFIWIDEPESIVAAVATLLADDKTDR